MTKSGDLPIQRQHLIKPLLKSCALGLENRQLKKQLFKKVTRKQFHLITVEKATSKLTTDGTDTEIVLWRKMCLY